MKHPILASLTASGWRISTFLLAVTAAAAMTFGSPAALKSALKESGVYPAVADQLASRASDALIKETGPATDQKAVEAAAKENITPESLQKSAEQNIDNAYIWLEGKTDKPDIKIDLSPYVDGFTNQIGNTVLQKTKDLPICTAEQLRQIDPAKVDVLNLPCKPPGVNLDSAKNQAIAQATKSNEFLSNPVITTDSLPKDAEGKTAIDRAANVPDVYTWGMRAPLIFGVLAVFSAIAFVLLVRPDWRQAASRLGRSMFFVGVLLGVIAIGVNFLLNYFTKPGGAANKMAGDEMKDAALAFVTSIEKAYTNRLLWFAVCYAVVGGLVWLAVRFIKPATDADAEPETEPVADESESAAKPALTLQQEPKLATAVSTREEVKPVSTRPKDTDI